MKKSVIYVIMFMIGVGACQGTNRSETSIEQQTPTQIIQGVQYLSAELADRKSHSLPLANKYISGQPFGFMKWTVGETRHGFYIEVHDMTHGTCDAVKEHLLSTQEVLINGQKGGSCEPDSSMRFIFKVD